MLNNIYITVKYGTVLLWQMGMLKIQGDFVYFIKLRVRDIFQSEYQEPPTICGRVSMYMSQ